MSSSEPTFLSGLRLELPYLIDALAKGRGFAHPDPQFQFLAEIIADHRLYGAEPPSSFLVAGCDQGVDAYSLCLTLLEANRKQPGLAFSILGTDFLPANLEHAQRGMYAAKVVDNLPANVIRRYFLRSRDTSRALVRLKPGVRKLVQFRCLDIFAPFGLRENMDVIVCRQVLHHFAPALAAALTERLRQHLVPGGILVLGEPVPRTAGLRHLSMAVYQVE